MGRAPSLVFLCSNCRRHVTGRKHASYWPEQHFEVLFVSCPECHRPFVLGTPYDSYLQGAETVDVYDYPSEVLLPAPVAALDSSVPQNVAASYSEAFRCFNETSSYTASALMCRRTIEGICSHLLADGKDLKAKISNLKQRGLIDAPIHEWAQYVLRGTGNQAAHNADEVVSPENAKDALEFTKAILEYVFVFQAAFQSFKERNPDMLSREQHTRPPWLKAPKKKKRRRHGRL